MSHYAVHIPIDKDMRFFPKYVRKGLSDKDAAYASLVEGMDKKFGRYYGLVGQKRRGEKHHYCIFRRQWGLGNIARVA